MTSWEIIETWTKMGRWNKLSFLILWGWVSLLIFSPYIIENNSTGDLSGVVGKYDNENVISDMNIAAKGIYYLGDLNCHQLSHRSYEYNNNQMPFCARDVGIFLGLAIGFIVSLGRRINITLPIIILSLIPIGLDGTIQLVTEYESTNPKRIITGMIAGIATGISLKIIADSLDRN